MSWDPKDPDEVLDYDIDWSARLVEGDTIVTSTWLQVVPPDAALVIDSDSRADSATKVWLSGGTLNSTYSMTNRVTTTGGRTMDHTEKLKIKAK